MKRSILLAGLCSLALVAAGCGDDDDNQALSYEETGAEIGAICDGLQVLGNDLNGEPANDAPILEELVPELQTAVDEVAALEVNEELEAARDAFVANGEESAALLAQAQAEAEAGDKKAYRATLRESGQIDQAGNQFANDLGAEGCIN